MVQEKQTTKVTSIESATFRRGIYNKDFELLNTDPLWKEIKKDKSLIPCIRLNEIHIYYKGCKICGIIWNNKNIVYETHHKYLKLEKLSGDYIKYNSDIDDKNGILRKLGKSDLKEFIGFIKNNAEAFAIGEKIDIHKIIENNPNIIDLEISFGGIDAISKEGKMIKLHKRIDFAFLIETPDSELEIQFFESKQYSYTSSLRCSGKADAPIIGQMKLYDDLIFKLGSEIANSYEKIIENFTRLGIDDWHRYRGKKLKVNPKSNLIITNVDKSTNPKGLEVWDGHLEKITNRLNASRVHHQIGDDYKIDIK